MKNKTVHYLCFYCEAKDKETLVSYPSVWSKIDYVKETVLDLGFNVNIISAAPIKNKGFYRKNTVKISENESHQYLSSFKVENKIINSFNILFMFLQIIYRILKIHKDDIVLVYHTLFYDRPLKILNKIFKKNFYLEIEDVYSELGNESVSRRKKSEWDFFEIAKGYLTVNDIVADKICNDKMKVISYGRYIVPEKHKIVKGDNIKLVYAGVIEQERGAAFIAVKTMMHLSEQYELHICGFGSNDNIKEINRIIKEINQKLNRRAIVFHGMKIGEEYEKLLQSCDIGLSTHSYDDTNMSSAEHTFPSKVLVYISNGLRVVSQKLQVLEKSRIGDLLYYYDAPEPKKIAETIMRIDFNDEYDGRSRISNLDMVFRTDIKAMLGEK